MNKYFSVILVLSLLYACGGGGGGSSDNNTTPTTPDTPAEQVTISGTISYDKVPHEGDGSAVLDFANIQVRPARGVEVFALDSAGNSTATTTTNELGEYSLTVDSNTSLRLEATTHLLNERWSVKVTDNTQGNAIYSLQGALINSGTSNSTRNLHASHSPSRASAPFAILDIAYELMTNIDDVTFPAMEFRWSVNNSTTSGDLASGDIGTSFYTVTNGLPTIYLLGDANALGDSDEYDEDIVAHEFTHYLEGQIARSDSIGGSHSVSSILDLRLAWSEGISNAVSGMINGDQYYVDSFFNAQGQSRTAVSIDLEDNDLTSQSLPTGWYSEAAIQALAFDLVDSNQDGIDQIDLTVNEFFQLLIAPEFKESPALTSIFSFHESFGANRPSQLSDLEAMMTAFDIFGRGEWAEGETNNAFLSNVLPIYQDVVLNTVNTLCSINTHGEYNKLSNLRFMRLELTETNAIQIEAERSSGNTSSDPDILVIQQGNLVAQGTSSENNQETVTTTLSAGNYVISVGDYFNQDNDTNTGGITCFDVTVSLQ